MNSIVGWYGPHNTKFEYKTNLFGSVKIKVKNGASVNVPGDDLADFIFNYICGLMSSDMRMPQQLTNLLREAREERVSGYLGGIKYGSAAKKRKKETAP